jgi:hypothetical protein
MPGAKFERITLKRLVSGCAILFTARTAKRIMIFAIIGPDSWTLFRWEQTFVWTHSIRQLIETEQGISGLVFRDAQSGI